MFVSTAERMTTGQNMGHAPPPPWWCPHFLTDLRPAVASSTLSCPFFFCMISLKLEMRLPFNWAINFYFLFYIFIQDMCQVKGWKITTFTYNNYHDIVSFAEWELTWHNTLLLLIFSVVSFTLKKNWLFHFLFQFWSVCCIRLFHDLKEIFFSFKLSRCYPRYLYFDAAVLDPF